MKDQLSVPYQVQSETNLSFWAIFTPTEELSEYVCANDFFLII